MIKIPLVPQWNLNSGCVCTPDGGFLYVGSRSINFISSIIEDNETPTIRCFHTRQNILSLDVDPHWGRYEQRVVEGENKEAAAVPAKEITKLFVALQQDNSVQIWDFSKGCVIKGHKTHVVNMCHMEGNGPSPQHTGPVLISYMCNRNVLSVDHQDIVIYCVASNSFYRRPMFLSSRKHQLTSLKCSPYNENHFACGTKRGLVLLCDLQKMVNLYTLRGHDSTITGLAWNRVDLPAESLSAPEKNVEGTEQKPKPIQKQQSKGKFSRAATIDTDQIFDIYDYDYLENEFGAPTQYNKQKNEFISDFVGIEKPKESSTTAKFDFAEACQSLKEEINALREEQPQMSPEHMVSLEECKQAASIRNDLSSCGSDIDDEADNKDKPRSDKVSSNGSLVQLACRTASSEESVDVDGMDRNKQQNIICQAEIHNSQSQDNEDVKSTETMQTEINDDCHIDEEPPTQAHETKCIDTKEMCDILLASTSVDGTFCIWNAWTGATCDSHKIRSSQAGKNSRIEISWISSTSFIINNKSGDLQYWTIQPLPNDKRLYQSGFKLYKFKETKRRWSQRSVISFAASSIQNLLWCISSHREVTLEDLKLNKIKLHYNCVSSNIGAMQECPDDMNKIVLGFSDRRIGIIDISKMTPTSVKIENFVQRIESPVMTLAWSPDCKKIAYGTTEGRIGIINVEGNNKQPPFTFNCVCGKIIYSISWLDKYIFVVCNERIAVYEDDINKKDPYVIPEINSVSSISLNNNYLFAGTQNGHIQLYARVDQSNLKYELKKSLELSRRYITQISWSPIATNKLAVVSMVNNIHVLEFNHETADLQILRKIEINSPKAANACVKWSNRNGNYFLTCGFDGAVRVWDISNETNPLHFVKTYHCPMTCGLFLPTDEDIIICSGKSATLEFIDMRLEKTESITETSQLPNPRTLDNVQWATKAVTSDHGKSNNKKTNRHVVKTPENNVELLELKELTTTAITTEKKIENGVTNSEEVSTMLEKLHLEAATNNASIYMKNPSTLLYLTTKELNKDALELMFNILTAPTKSSDNKSLCVKLFGSKLEAKELLAEELKNHQNSVTKGISSLFMPQLTTNLKDEILKCVQAKQLCEWHVSLAPSISYSFWQKCSQAYAEQLLEQGYALQAAVYMLAIHQQHGAIEMLLKQKYFKEALLIARIYLQPEDPLNNSISDEWITYLQDQGNLTAAALLCLLTKQNNRAYECLAKIRNTVPEIERVIRVLKSSDT